MTGSPMSAARVFTGTSLAMLEFAGNSVLCRLALSHTPIDPASFTTVRLVSGVDVAPKTAPFTNGGTLIGVPAQLGALQQHTDSRMETLGILLIEPRQLRTVEIEHAQ